MQVPITANVPLAQIEVPEHRFRTIKEPHVEELMESFKTNEMFFEPIKVVQEMQNHYVLIDGQHRFEAAKRLGHSSIVCNIYRNLSDDQRRRIEIESNYTKEDLTWLERAKGTYELSIIDRRERGLDTDRLGTKSDPATKFYDKMKEQHRIGERTVQQDIQIGKKIQGELFDIINEHTEQVQRTTGLAISRFDDEYLDRIVRAFNDPLWTYSKHIKEYLLGNKVDRLIDTMKNIDYIEELQESGIPEESIHRIESTSPDRMAKLAESAGRIRKGTGTLEEIEAFELLPHAPDKAIKKLEDLQYRTKSEQENAEAKGGPVSFSRGGHFPKAVSSLGDEVADTRNDFMYVHLIERNEEIYWMGFVPLSQESGMTDNRMRLWRKVGIEYKDSDSFKGIHTFEQKPTVDGSGDYLIDGERMNRRRLLSFLNGRASDHMYKSFYEKQLNGKENK